MNMNEAYPTRSERLKEVTDRFNVIKISAKKTVGPIE